MNLYVIRHGRTDDNDKGIFNGRYDEDINKTGIEQAKKASREVAKLNIDLIICSPLLRTRHTMELINVNNVPVIYDELLMERDYGELTCKSVKLTEGHNMWGYNKSVDFEGLEQAKDIINRGKKCLDNIKNKYADKNILIVTHNGMARAIYAYFNGIPEDGNLYNCGRQDNCEIKKYEW